MQKTLNTFCVCMCVFLTLKSSHSIVQFLVNFALLFFIIQTFKNSTPKVYIHYKDEEDICPACYSSDKKMYAGAGHLSNLSLYLSFFAYFADDEHLLFLSLHLSPSISYIGAEHQKFGEPVPLVVKKREAPKSNGVAKKSKIEWEIAWQRFSIMP